jgi:tRNA G26 N,N-dimethylase Trm1
MRNPFWAKNINDSMFIEDLVRWHQWRHYRKKKRIYDLETFSCYMWYHKMSYKQTDRVQSYSSSTGRDEMRNPFWAKNINDSMFIEDLVRWHQWRHYRITLKKKLLLEKTREVIIDDLYTRYLYNNVVLSR